VKSDRSSRRAFLGAAGMASVAAAAEQQIKPGVPARSASRVVGANDRIRVGMIGLGGMGTVHLQAFMKQADDEKDIQVVAVSDVFTKRKNRARDIAKLTDKDVHHDYRDLLARNDVDAILIAAPDHWHGQMALDALAAGKDVYLEKPMTHTLEEARAIVDAVKKYGRILQVGNQGLSAPSTHKLKEIIASGEIGPLLCAQATSARNSLLGEWNYRIEPEGTPETIDWPRWLGPAPKRPFSPDRYFRFRKYWDYSGGIATDLFFHALGPILYPMGAQFPTRVSAHGGIYVHKDREVPDTYSTTIEYPNFYIEMSGSMANSGMGTYHRQAIYGHKGTLVVEGGRVMLYRETFPELRQQGRPEPKAFELPPEAPQRDARTPHTTNFFSCVRSRKQPNAPAEVGYQIISAIKLGVYAYREGRTKLFDPATRRIVDKAPARPSYEGDGKNHTVAELGIKTN
jgi:predicted dehydrogenase